MSKLKTLMEKQEKLLETVPNTDKQAEQFANKLAKVDEQIVLEQEKLKQSNEKKSIKKNKRVKVKKSSSKKKSTTKKIIKSK